MNDYTDIIRRLTEAGWPRRDLDWEVYASSGVKAVGMYGDHPHYTASLDASIALCERMLPNHGRLHSKGRLWNDEPLYGVKLYANELNVGDDPHEIAEAEHNHEPIALLIAMFRALAQSKAGE